MDSRQNRPARLLTVDSMLAKTQSYLEDALKVISDEMKSDKNRFPAAQYMLSYHLKLIAAKEKSELHKLERRFKESKARIAEEEARDFTVERAVNQSGGTTEVDQSGFVSSFRPSNLS